MPERAIPAKLTLRDAMARAVELAHRGPEYGPNPRVGCVLLGQAAGEDEETHRTERRYDGTPWELPGDRLRPVLGAGWHLGADTPHAEVAAIADALEQGRSLVGATAVVTLEPCAHTGRTGPCAQALIEAGVAAVVYAVEDPNPVAAGGAEMLRAAGVRVMHAGHEGAATLVHRWATATARERPYVTLKLAATLDGRVAAGDGSSQWITGELARHHAHTVRATVDAIAVGTGTVLADDPSLTARSPGPEPAPHQPLRVVVGRREIPADARVRGPGLVRLRSHDVDEVLAELWSLEVHHLLVEGGPTLSTAFLAAGRVDELHAYIAPLLLGTGLSAVGDLGVRTLSQAPRFRTQTTQRLGEDVLLMATQPDDEES